MITQLLFLPYHYFSIAYGLTASAALLNIAAGFDAVSQLLLQQKPAAKTANVLLFTEAKKRLLNNHTETGEK